MNAELQNHFVQQYMDAKFVRFFHFKPGEPICISDSRERDKVHYCSRLTVTTSADNEGRYRLLITNSPMTHDLRDALRERGGLVQWNLDTDRADASITLSIKDVGYLRQLAKAYRRTVGPGARYRDCNWKWICPRTADSLDQFAACLMEFRRRRRPGAAVRTMECK